jgi:dihydroxyacetone kinase-like protein
MTTDSISNHAIRIIQKVSQDLEQAQDYLTSLDAAIGDGDHGVSMTIAARAVRKRTESFRNEPLSRILTQCGQLIQSQVGATMGALYGNALIHAGKAFDGVETLSLNDVDRAFQAALDAIRDMGRAQAGEKTVVDAMAPAVQAIHDSIEQGTSIPEAIANATEAARLGMEATCNMVSTRGRASRLGDRSLGAQDPGATSFYLILKSIAEYVKPEFKAHPSSLEKNG